MNEDNKKIYRVLDANINRVKEGLRVLEEIMRFVLDNAKFTACIKQIRHQIIDTVKIYFDVSSLKLSRDTESDVGRETYTLSEGKRENVRDVFMANMTRVQEGLRVLEEFSKLINQDAGLCFKNLRYELYILEKDMLGQL